MAEAGAVPWLELSCSFQFLSPEYGQLDMKWYYGQEEQPFLQWVPSSGRSPQTIGQRLKTRLETRHSLTNTTEGFLTEQVIRVLRPTIHTSGDYTCRVATFTQEEAATHRLIVFGKTVHVPAPSTHTPVYSRPRCRALPVPLLPPSQPQPVLLCLASIPRAKPLLVLVQRALPRHAQGGHYHHHNKEGAHV